MTEVYRNLFLSLILISIGTYFFFDGFQILRIRRLVENIPTSTIRGLAIGLVEICGVAKRYTSLIAPISQIPCVFYEYVIEKNSNNGWNTVATGDSSSVPFYVKDDTGKILLLPQNAEFMITKGEDFRVKPDAWSQMPSHLKTLLGCHNITEKKFIFLDPDDDPHLRLREWIINEEDQIYVLGHAQKSNPFDKEIKKKTLKILATLQKDPIRRQIIDFDKDGKVSQEEWRIAKAKIQKKLTITASQHSETGDVKDVVIAKGTKNEPYIISDQSQKNVNKNLSNNSQLSILGGTIAIIIGFYFSLKSLGIF